MKLKEIIKELNLKTTLESDLDREVTGGYASDLLSDVMGNCPDGYLWITLQIHPNIIAVATMKDIPAIVLINNRQPEEETVKMAAQKKINILVSDLPAFELAGRLYKMGIKGK